MRKFRKLGLWLAAPLVALILAGLFLPWGEWTGQLLRNELARRGIALESFVVDGISLDGLKFSQVKITQPVVLHIPELALALSREALLHRRWSEAVSYVTLRGLPVKLERKADGSLWLNEQALPASKTAKKDLSALESAAGGLSAFSLFPEIDAEDIAVTYRQPGLTFETSLTAHSRRVEYGLDLEVQASTPKLTMMEGKGKLMTPLLHLNLSYRASAGMPTAHAILNYGGAQWNAPAQSIAFDGETTLAFTGTNAPTARTRLKNFHAESGAVKLILPELALDATMARGIKVEPGKFSPVFPLGLTVTAAKMQLEGLLKEAVNADITAECLSGEKDLRCAGIQVKLPLQKVQADGHVGFAYAAPEKMQWAVKGQATDVMGGGLHFSAAPGKAGGFSAVEAAISAQKLSLQQVLAVLAEGKVTATGSVSGNIPFTWLGGQKFRFGSGALTSDGPGSIQLAPELLAVGNPQLAMVSGILADLQYKELGITLDSDEQGRLKAKLSVLGNNPAQLDGRFVKLNVNLSGDLLSLLQTSILPMSDPKQWLQTPQNLSQ